MIFQIKESGWWSEIVTGNTYQKQNKQNYLWIEFCARWNLWILQMKSLVFIWLTKQYEMQCDSTISIEKEGRNSEQASVPSIVQISSTHFHSIFPFHFASSNPSFFIDPIASTISNKRFFFFIINEFAHKHGNSIGSDGVVSISFELDHDTSFDLANDLHKLVPFPTFLSEASVRWTSARDSRLQ